jgi:hypothetical protein
MVIIPWSQELLFGLLIGFPRPETIVIAIIEEPQEEAANTQHRNRGQDTSNALLVRRLSKKNTNAAAAMTVFNA